MKKLKDAKSTKNFGVGLVFFERGAVDKCVKALWGRDLCEYIMANCEWLMSGRRRGEKARTGGSRRDLEGHGEHEEMARMGGSWAAYKTTAERYQL